MKKRNSLILIVGLLVCVLSMLAENSYAQKVAVKSDETQKSAKKSILQQYIDISSASTGEMRKIFGELSAVDKAEMFRLHLSLQLVKRQSLTAGQKEFILDALSQITPDLYADNNAKREKTKQNVELLTLQAKALFAPKEVFEIFGNLGSAEDLVRLKKYESLAPLTMASRRQVFREASAAEKEDFWKIHVVMYFYENRGMHAYQNSFLLSLSDFLTPSNFVFSSESPEWEKKIVKPSQDIFQRAQQLFSKEETYNLLSRLGGVPGNSDIASLLPNCQCHRGWADACIDGCVGNICEPTWGCGLLFLYSCNGTGCFVYPNNDLNK